MEPEGFHDSPAGQIGKVAYVLIRLGKMLANRMPLIRFEKSTARAANPDRREPGLPCQRRAPGQTRDGVA